MRQFDDILATINSVTQDLGRAVIAGGAVRDMLLGKKEFKDIDVFLLMGEKFVQKDLQRIVGPRLKDFPGVDLQLEWHKSEPFLVKSLKIHDTEVQVMASPHSTLAELVTTFDW